MESKNQERAVKYNKYRMQHNKFTEKYGVSKTEKPNSTESNFLEYTRRYFGYYDKK